MANTPTLEVLYQLKMLALVGSRYRYIGDKNALVNPTVAGQIYEDTFTLNDNYGNAILWTSGQGNITNFKYLVVVSDQDIILEVANTTPNPDERALFLVTANVPFILPAVNVGGYANNVSRLNGAAIVSGTGYNLINEIRAQRNVATGSGAANVRLSLIN